MLAINRFVDDHGVTCDCCQHVLIDVTAMRDGGRSHVVAGDPEGEGSACAHGWSDTVRRLQAENERLRGEICEHKARVDCLAMFVRRLYRKLRKHEPDAEVIRQANTYLKAIGQAGTPLRIEECAVAPPASERREPR